MLRLLIIDDEEPLLRNLRSYLESSKDEFEVATAVSAEAGLELLERRPFDVLLTDVYLPGLDGIDLIPLALRCRPSLQIMVMTAFDSPELHKRALRRGAIRFLRKPLDLNELKSRLRDVAARDRKWAGVIGDLDIYDLTQLLMMTARTKVVRVVLEDRTGVLVFRDGSLKHAAAGSLKGPEAFYEMTEWEGGGFEELQDADVSEFDENIRVSTTHLMMEAARLHDEAVHEQELAAAGAMAAAGKRAPSRGRARPGRAGAGPSGGRSQRSTKKKEQEMALESYLEEFKGIKGYKAAGVMDFTGELIAHHSADASVNLEATGAVFNDIFRAAHEASGKIGFGACNKMVITTPAGLIVMECSGVEAASHLHFIVILEMGGNQALVRVTLDKIVPQVVAAMS